MAILRCAIGYWPICATMAGSCTQLGTTTVPGYPDKYTTANGTHGQYQHHHCQHTAARRHPLCTRIPRLVRGSQGRRHSTGQLELRPCRGATLSLFSSETPLANTVTEREEERDWTLISVHRERKKRRERRDGWIPFRYALTNARRSFTTQGPTFAYADIDNGVIFLANCALQN